MNLFAVLTSAVGQAWKQEFFANLWAVVNNFASLKQAVRYLLTNDPKYAGVTFEQTTQLLAILENQDITLEAFLNDASLMAWLQRDKVSYTSINAIIRDYGYNNKLADYDRLLQAREKLRLKLLIAADYARYQLQAKIAYCYGVFYANLVVNSSYLINFFKNFVKYQSAKLYLNSISDYKELSDAMDHTLQQETGLENFELFVVLLEEFVHDCHKKSMATSLAILKILSDLSAPEGAVLRLTEAAVSLNNLLLFKIKNNRHHRQSLIAAQAINGADLVANNLGRFFDASSGASQLEFFWHQLQQLEPYALPLYVELLHELNLKFAARLPILEENKIQELELLALEIQVACLSQPLVPDLMATTITMLNLRISYLSYQLRSAACTAELEEAQVKQFDADIATLQTIAQQLTAISTNVDSSNIAVRQLAAQWAILSDGALAAAAQEPMVVLLQQLTTKCDSLFITDTTTATQLLNLLQASYGIRLLSPEIYGAYVEELKQLLACLELCCPSKDLLAYHLKRVTLWLETAMPMWQDATNGAWILPASTEPQQAANNASYDYNSVAGKTREVMAELEVLIAPGQQPSAACLMLLELLLDTVCGANANDAKHLELLQQYATTIEAKFYVQWWWYFINRVISLLNKILVLCKMPELALINVVGPLLTKVNELVELLRNNNDLAPARVCPPRRRSSIIVVEFNQLD